MRCKRFNILCLLAFVALLLNADNAKGQGMHFSQYYNAPMLLNPANTALLSDADYRLGLNYRSQWSSVPVPFNTFSGYADFQAFRNNNLTNWMGFGLAMFNDVAGDGQLGLSRYEGCVAYHIQTGNYTMFSVGMSGAYVQRSVDFTKLTFDRQWDGFTFDPSMENGEMGLQAQTSFIDVNAGINIAYYPNEYTYVKLGIGAAHVNQPKESFYGQSNKILIRPTANLDLIWITNEMFTINPSVYYTRQGSAQQLMYGLKTRIFISEDNFGNPTNVIAGLYHRYNDAIVPVLGFEWAGVQFLTSYDFTLSSLAADINNKGALEFSLLYKGVYTKGRDKMNCPRF